MTWQPPPCWEVGLDSEGLESEPGMSWGFSKARGQPLPYQGWGQGPRSWSRSMEGVGFLPDVLALCMMTEATAGAWGPGTALLYRFYYFPGVPSWLDTRSGLKGLESHYRAVSTCSQVCTWMRTPAVTKATPELIPLPPKATHTPPLTRSASSLVRGRVRAQVNSIPFKYAQFSWQWLPSSREGSRRCWSRSP